NRSPTGPRRPRGRGANGPRISHRLTRPMLQPTCPTTTNGPYNPGALPGRSGRRGPGSVQLNSTEFELALAPINPPRHPLCVIWVGEGFRPHIPGGQNG